MPNPHPAIIVENLGKKYFIRHRRKEGYKTLRDVLANNVKALGRRLIHRQTSCPPIPSKEEFWALKNVSFEIIPGERIGVIGRNGAGKSTLLKLLSRITDPSDGRIELLGRVGSLLEVGTGFHPELTGRENIFLNGAILGMSRDDIRKRFDEIVAFAEVGKFLDTPVKRYSSGMYVRLAFAVAAHLEPEILLVDEVLAVGDAQFQKKCLGKMEEAGSEGRTVLFVSHNMSIIANLCDQTILMDGGRIVMQGATKNVVQKYLEMGIGTESGQVKWEGGTGDDIVKLFAIRVCDESGKVCTTMDVAKSFYLELEYEVYKEFEDLRVGFRILTADATLILLSIDSDSEENKSKRPGYYKMRVPIPGNFLNVGKYFVTVGADIPNRMMNFFHENCVSFSVEQTTIIGGEHGIGRMGIVRPLFKWERVSDRSGVGEK